MNKNSKRLGIYIVITLLATAVATTLRTIACTNYLDYDGGFFSEKIIVNAANVIMALTAIGVFSYLFVAERISLRVSFSTPATYVPTGILAVASAFLSAKIFSYVLVSNNYDVFGRNGERIISTERIAAFIGIAAAVLAFASILHHFFNAFVTEAKSVTRAYFAITTIAFLTLYAVMIYLDGSISLNESTKTLRQTTALLVAVFFLYEARISLGREMLRMYTAMGLSAMAMCAYTAIPALVTYYSKGVILSSSGYKSLASVEEYLLFLALFIFILARLCLVASFKEEKESELVRALATAAEERELKVRESEEMYKDTYAAKQLSIFDLYGEDGVKAESEPEPEPAALEAEEEESEPIISDDAIYESIFGKMPERPVEEDEKEEAPAEDDREPEQIAEDILNALDEALKENADNA